LAVAEFTKLTRPGSAPHGGQTKKKGKRQKWCPLESKARIYYFYMQFFFSKQTMRRRRLGANSRPRL
jgi:hypothetical protein